MSEKKKKQRATPARPKSIGVGETMRAIHGLEVTDKATQDQIVLMMLGGRR